MNQDNDDIVIPRGTATQFRLAMRAWRQRRNLGVSGDGPYGEANERRRLRAAAGRQRRGTTDEPQD